MGDFLVVFLVFCWLLRHYINDIIMKYLELER